MKSKIELPRKGNSKNDHSRRKFIGTLAATATLSGFAGSLLASSGSKIEMDSTNEADAWFQKVNGAHRVVYDVPEPNNIFPFAWPRVFLMTNEMTGSETQDCGVVVVLRHEAMPFALENRLWGKYHLGEVINFDDPVTQKPSLRNPFWQPGPNDFIVPGIGPVEIGINQLQESGVMFCVCNMAITVDSGAIAQKMGLDHEEVKKDIISGILPGIQLVPSGVWALGRAQEHGCTYIFAG